MTYWFTADCHFHHTNIIKYCNRPFATIEQMNEELIKRWRDTVKPEDTVFHIGDFSFANKEITSRIINVLTGTIVFLKGNHESHPKTIIESLMIRYEGHSISEIIFSHDGVHGMCKLIITVTAVSVITLNGNCRCN